MNDYLQRSSSPSYIKEEPCLNTQFPIDYNKPPNVKADIMKGEICFVYPYKIKKIEIAKFENCQAFPQSHQWPAKIKSKQKLLRKN